MNAPCVTRRIMVTLFENLFEIHHFKLSSRLSFTDFDFSQNGIQIWYVGKIQSLNLIQRYEFSMI
jgi:hypothetical protein